MQSPLGPRAPLGVRAVRHVGARTLVVLAVCAVVALVSWRSYSRAAGELSAMTARASFVSTSMRSSVVPGRETRLRHGAALADRLSARQRLST